MTEPVSPIGKGAWISCDLTPEDVLSVQAADSTLGKIVAISVWIEEEDVEASIVLAPNRARAPPVQLTRTCALFTIRVR